VDILGNNKELPDEYIILYVSVIILLIISVQYV
jgi:hypothetical protein